MIGEVLVGSLAAYRLDAAGNLIRLSARGNPNALIPYAVDLVTPQAEMIHPMAWTVAPEMVIARMQTLPRTMALENEISTVIVTNKLPTAAFPFVPPAQSQETDETIEQAIELMDSLSLGDPARLDLEQVLNTCGVYRIPRTPAFCEGIHIRAKLVDSFEYVSDGWMSSMRVYRKSVVRSD